MSWSESLDIGVQAMNAEHAELLKAMNAVYDAYRAGIQGSVVDNLISDLVTVCVRHFADEERFMQEIGYPGLKTHKVIHENLIHELLRHASIIRAARGKANDEFFGFLQRWLIAHIKGVDIKYGAYYRDHACETA